MLKPLLNRIVSLALVPCLLTDPTTSFAIGQFRAQGSELRNIPEFCSLSSEFGYQALAPRFEFAPMRRSIDKVPYFLRRQIAAAYLLYLRGVLWYAERETPGHVDRVARYAAIIAEEMNLPPAIVEEVRYAGKFHDLGKFGVPKRILKKPGALNEEERAIMKKHPAIGARLLINPILMGREPPARVKMASQIALHHHEQPNGKGYPLGLKGEQIPLLARILAVADNFDALTKNRPYRKALSVQEANRIIQAYSGSQFDPKVVEVFLRSSTQRRLQSILDESLLAQRPASESLMISFWDRLRAVPSQTQAYFYITLLGAFFLLVLAPSALAGTASNHLLLSPSILAIPASLAATWIIARKRRLSRSIPLKDLGQTPVRAVVRGPKPPEDISARTAANRSGDVLSPEIVDMLYRHFGSQSGKRLQNLSASHPGVKEVVRLVRMLGLLLAIGGLASYAIGHFAPHSGSMMLGAVILPGWLGSIRRLIIPANIHQDADLGQEIGKSMSAGRHSGPDVGAPTRLTRTKTARWATLLLALASLFGGWHAARAQGSSSIQIQVEQVPDNPVTLDRQLESVMRDLSDMPSGMSRQYKENVLGVLDEIIKAYSNPLLPKNRHTIATDIEKASAFLFEKGYFVYIITEEDKHQTDRLHFRAMLFHLSRPNVRPVNGKSITLYHVRKISGYDKEWEGLQGKTASVVPNTIFIFDKENNLLVKRLNKLRVKQGLKFKEAWEDLSDYYSFDDPTVQDIVMELLRDVPEHQLADAITEQIAQHETVHTYIDMDHVSLIDSEIAPYAAMIAYSKHPYFQLVRLAQNLKLAEFVPYDEALNDPTTNAASVIFNGLLDQLLRAGLITSEERNSKSIVGVHNGAEALAVIHLLRSKPITDEDIRDATKSFMEERRYDVPPFSLISHALEAIPDGGSVKVVGFGPLVTKEQLADHLRNGRVEFKDGKWYPVIRGASGKDDEERPPAAGSTSLTASPEQSRRAAASKPRSFDVSDLTARSPAFSSLAAMGLLTGNKIFFIGAILSIVGILLLRLFSRKSQFATLFLWMVLAGNIGAGSARYLLFHFWKPAKVHAAPVIKVNPVIKPELPISVVIAPKPSAPPIKDGSIPWGLIEEKAHKHGIDPDLGKAVLNVETHFYLFKNKVSEHGAIGPTQIKLETAQRATRNPRLTEEELKEWGPNLEAGFTYLRQMLDTSPGNLVEGLESYKEGPGYTRDHPAQTPEDIPKDVARAYVRDVLASKAAWKAWNQMSPEGVPVVAYRKGQRVSKEEMKGFIARGGVTYQVDPDTGKGLWIPHIRGGSSKDEVQSPATPESLAIPKSAYNAMSSGPLRKAISGWEAELENPDSATYKRFREDSAGLKDGKGRVILSSLEAHKRFLKDLGVRTNLKGPVVYYPFGGFDPLYPFTTVPTATDVISMGAFFFGSVNDLIKVAQANDTYLKSGSGAAHKDFDSEMDFRHIQRDEELHGLGSLALGRIIAPLRGRIDGIYYFRFLSDGNLDFAQDATDENGQYANAVIEFTDSETGQTRRYWYVQESVEELSSGYLHFIERLKFQTLFLKAAPSSLFEAVDDEGHDASERRNNTLLVTVAPAKRVKANVITDERAAGNYETGRQSPYPIWRAGFRPKKTTLTERGNQFGYSYYEGSKVYYGTADGLIDLDTPIDDIPNYQGPRSIRKVLLSALRRTFTKRIPPAPRAAAPTPNMFFYRLAKVLRLPETRARRIGWAGLGIEIFSVLNLAQSDWLHQLAYSFDYGPSITFALLTAGFVLLHKLLEWLEPNSQIRPAGLLWQWAVFLSYLPLTAIEPSGLFSVFLFGIFTVLPVAFHIYFDSKQLRQENLDEEVQHLWAAYTASGNTVDFGHYLDAKFELHRQTRTRRSA